MIPAIKEASIADYLRREVEPLEHPAYGKQYRVSARLTDGTHLPCVVFQSSSQRVSLALKRFKELRWRRQEYERVVASFVTGGSHISSWAIASVEQSPFAWPPALLKTIHGETAMSWTSFVAEMTDGTFHSFGTTFLFEFFELPEGYRHQDIKTIHSGMVYSERSGLTPYSLSALKEAIVNRERPFFTCFLDQL
jgi:hypothetical protein